MAQFGITRQLKRQNDNEAPINWRRGLFRVWLLFSAAWVLGWVVYLALYGIKGGFKNVADLLQIPVLLIAPPIALLLFGVMTRWAFKGFAVDGD
jgi:hypothetical protein